MRGARWLIVLAAFLTLGAKECKDIKIPPPPLPSPSTSASPTSSPSPLPSVTPSPVDSCAGVTCPDGQRCMLEESLPPRAVCIPLPSPSPVITPTPTPAPSVQPSVSPSPVASPIACDQPTREPRPSLGRQGNVIASQSCARGASGDSPYWKINYHLVAHDAGSIPEMEKRMLEDGSGGYAVVSNGDHKGWPMDFWGRLYSCFPPTAGCLAHTPEDGYSNVCTPPPCPQPTPPPTPRPSVSPIPEPSTDPGAKCAANGLKLGLRATVDKRNDCKDCKGFRNSFEVTPTRNGVPQGPETGCGEAFIQQYGEIVGKIIESGGRESGFEHQGCSLEDYNRDPKGCNVSDFYLFVDATNSDGDGDHWSGKTYLAGGPRTYCVTWPHLTTWRCQDGMIDDRGAAVGFGRNDQAYDRPKQ